MEKVFLKRENHRGVTIRFYTKANSCGIGPKEPNVYNLGLLQMAPKILSIPYRMLRRTTSSLYRGGHLNLVEPLGRTSVLHQNKSLKLRPKEDNIY